MRVAIKLKPIEECMKIDKSLYHIGTHFWDCPYKTAIGSSGISYKVPYEIGEVWVPFSFVEEKKKEENEVPEEREKSKNSDSNESVYFVRHGNDITAVWKKNGKVVDRAVAKCCENDNFDMIKGCMIALSRMA